MRTHTYTHTLRKKVTLTHLVGLPQLLSHAPHLRQEVVQQEGPEEAAAATKCQQLFRHHVGGLRLQMDRKTVRATVGGVGQ